MIDHLSKRYYIVGCSQDITTKATAKLYYYGPLRYIGLPESITSDYGPQFIIDFTDELSTLIEVH